MTLVLLCGHYFGSAEPCLSRKIAMVVGCEFMPYPPQDDTWAWERLIVAKPEMAERFTGWDQLGGFAWARILSRRPEFADRCDWSKLKPLAGRSSFSAGTAFLS